MQNTYLLLDVLCLDERIELDAVLGSHKPARQPGLIDLTIVLIALHLQRLPQPTNQRKDIRAMTNEIIPALGMQTTGPG